MAHYKYRGHPPFNLTPFFRSPSPPQSSRVAKHYKDIFRDIRLFSRIDSGIHRPGPCVNSPIPHTHTLSLPLPHSFLHSHSFSSAKPSRNSYYIQSPPYQRSFRRSLVNPHNLKEKNALLQCAFPDLVIANLRWLNFFYTFDRLPPTCSSAHSDPRTESISRQG